MTARLPVTHHFKPFNEPPHPHLSAPTSSANDATKHEPDVYSARLGCSERLNSIPPELYVNLSERLRDSVGSESD